NAGCITIRDEYLWRSRVTAAELDQRDNTILHELAHMWFGDLVTMRWWDDIWLNESFAEWASHYCQAEIVKQYGGTDPWPGFTAGRKGWAFRQDQLPTTHPVAADMVDLDAVRHNFDGITYAKGASVLRQLVGLVGEDDFLKGVRAYLLAHEYGNASLDDLLGALQEASGKDLSSFTTDWLTTAGMNTLRLDVTTDDKGIITAAKIIQTAPKAYPTLRRHHLGIGGYELEDGKLVRQFGFELDATGATSDVPQLVGQPRPAMLLLNDGDMTFAKVRLDDASLATAIAHVANIADPLARVTVFTILQDMWRDAELPSGQFVSIVLACLATEPDMTALRNQLQAGRQAAIDYSAVQVRPANQAAWTAGLSGLLSAAAPASDTQLALATALIVGAALADTCAISGWLNDEGVPEGLPIDTDLRWLIVTALARWGRADDAKIEQTLAFDHTQAGMEHAAGARAALSDADTKAAAWQLATQSADVPNETLVQTCTNFWNFGQEDLTRRFAAQYWSVAEAIASGAGIWAGRGDAAADTVLTQLWPTPVADQAFVDQAETWLAARPDLPTPVSKIVRESIDRTKRMLAAQAASLA
ncbi:MAG: ERAP1-like C-terminal domain-containing protein, partial [Propionibacteriaceae bacterium]|nr:ERAP1-like C-terminal domain-containing protein [Propionibacteriaceae bacterium]